MAQGVQLFGPDYQEVPGDKVVADAHYRRQKGLLAKDPLRGAIALSANRAGAKLGDVVPYQGETFDPVLTGYVIERSYEVALEDIVQNPDPVADSAGGPTSFFVGHLPDCVFDELTISQDGPDFESYGPYDVKSDANIAVYGFQLRRVAGPDRGKVAVPFSGPETEISTATPEIIFRSALKQPWKHPLRFSETYGGPVEALAPTFVGVYAQGISPTAAGIEDWYANITIRFLVQPLQ